MRGITRGASVFILGHKQENNTIRTKTEEKPILLALSQNSETEEEKTHEKSPHEQEEECKREKHEPSDTADYTESIPQRERGSERERRERESNCLKLGI